MIESDIVGQMRMTLSISTCVAGPDATVMEELGSNLSVVVMYIVFPAEVCEYDGIDLVFFDLYWGFCVWVRVERCYQSVSTQRWIRGEAKP